MTLRTLIQKTPASAGKNRPNAQDQWLRHAAVCPIDELFVELNSSAEGLDSSQVDSARELYGGNAVSSPGSKPVSLRLLASFADPFTYILVFIAGVSVLTDWVFAQPGDRSITTPAIISFMILASGLLRFVQSERSTVAAASLAKIIEPCANVERDGDGGNETAVEQIVVGDVIHLSSGCVAPANMRIFSARDLFVSQASLTGESDSIEKLPFLSDAGEKCPVIGLDDLVLAGSTVISGHGRGVVVATGANTMIGEIAGSLASTPRKTSFDEGISSVSRLLVRLMATMVPIVFITSGITKGEWVDALLYSLSVAVGLTPEMLPMLVTCCLGKSAVDLSRDHVIVKRLDAIQDLGSINVLCCDKTGTLTEDRIVLERHLNVDGEEDLMVLERDIECGRRTYANMIKYVKLTVSSNFGNILSMLVAAALLPFLPMTAVQVLLLNLIYDLGCTAIPWDRVDDESIHAPRRWDVKSIKSFMLLFGPQSSVFDIATFALLFFLICPAAAGGSWDILSDAGRAVFVGTFQAGWFIESMLTQTLLVQLLRTERKPLVESRPALPLALMQTAGALVAVTLPFSPLASSLELHAIPAGGLAVLAAVVAGFVTTVLLARVAYARKHDSLL